MEFSICFFIFHTFYTTCKEFFLEFFQDLRWKIFLILMGSPNILCLEGGITGRGCSTKDKVYYKECETNSYGEGTEKFCYCNFYLCNRGAAGHAGQTVLLLSVILVSLHTRYNKLHSSIDARIILHHVDLNDS